MNLCIECDTEISAKATRCRKCNCRLVQPLAPVSKPLGPRALTVAERQAKWRVEHPGRARGANRRAKSSMRKHVAEYKAERGCEDCGITDARCLDLHHRDGEEKVMAVSEMMYRSSWKKVQSEMDKCRVLCANCHRIEHADDCEGSDITAQSCPSVITAQG